MSDFLDELEHELTRAARARSRDPGWAGGAADLRALGRGAMAVVSVAVVVLVAALVVVIGRHRVVAPAGHPAASSDFAALSAGAVRCRDAGGARPGASFVGWLSAGAPVSGDDARAAVRELHRAGAPISTAVVSDVRRVELPDVGMVTLVDTRGCPGRGRLGAAQELFAELPFDGGGAIVDLGSARAINGGTAFHDDGVLVLTAHGARTISVLPTAAVAVVCRGARRYAVVDHLVVLPSTQPIDRCHPELS